MGAGGGGKKLLGPDLVFPAPPALHLNLSSKRLPENPSNSKGDQFPVVVLFVDSINSIFARLNFQRFRSNRHNRKRPRRMIAQISINPLDRQPVNLPLDFIQRPDSPAHEKVLRDRPAPGAGRFPLHDCPRLEADLGPVQLRLRDSLRQPMNFRKDAIQRRLRAIVARAGITEDRPRRFEAGISRPDAVTERRFSRTSVNSRLLIPPPNASIAARIA